MLRESGKMGRVAIIITKAGMCRHAAASSRQPLQHRERRGTRARWHAGRTQLMIETS